MRKRISNRERLRIFTAHDGTCHLCGFKIHTGEFWEVSHVIPLDLGGADDDSNRFPAHKKCHRMHTAMVDIPAIAKSRRIRTKHAGAHRSRSPMPCGRASKWKKTLSGKVVPR